MWQCLRDANSGVHKDHLYTQWIIHINMQHRVLLAFRFWITSN